MNKYWYREKRPYNIYYIDNNCVWYYRLTNNEYSYSKQQRGYVSNCTIKGGFTVPGASLCPIDRGATPFTLELIYEVNDTYDIPKDMLKDMLEELVK